MKPEFVLSFVAAALCHALLLFGFQLGSPARPLPVTDEAVDVSLVAAEPEVVEAPPPEPAPAPTPEPTPPMPEPAPAPQEEPMATPEPEPPREKPKPQPRREAPHAPMRNARRPALRAAATGSTVNAQPRYRSNPKPAYPAEARRLRQEGLVVLAVSVSADGRAASVSLKRSSGVLSLDQAAIEAVRRWTFEPARVGGLPVPNQIDVPVRFSISQ